MLSSSREKTGRNLFNLEKTRGLVIIEFNEDTMRQSCSEKAKNPNFSKIND